MKSLLIEAQSYTRTQREKINAIVQQRYISHTVDFKSSVGSKLQPRIFEQMGTFKRINAFRPRVYSHVLVELF